MQKSASRSCYRPVCCLDGFTRDLLQPPQVQRTSRQQLSTFGLKRAAGFRVRCLGTALGWRNSFGLCGMGFAAGAEGSVRRFVFNVKREWCLRSDENWSRGRRQEYSKRTKFEL